MNSTGIYETLITKVLNTKLEQSKDEYYVERQSLQPADAALYLSRFLQRILQLVLQSQPIGKDKVEQQIEFSNALIYWLRDYLNDADISENIIDVQGQLLTALYASKDPIARDLKEHVAKITPLTGLAQSELFTGSNVGLSLESEIKREILSADEICWLVSFIKWTGIRIFADVLKEFSESGRKIKIITTSYMGATDQKAVDFLSALPNCEVKLSYNTDQERLHAKTYIFRRNSEFDTAYIGSSNISRSALTNGLEWNLKVTTQEIPHIIEKFNATFDTYWSSPEFESYRFNEAASQDKLKRSLKIARGLARPEESALFFDIEPRVHQKAILECLTVEREIHNRRRNLVVAATGTGKTIISAFDFKQFKKNNRGAKLLFIAHREEILKQSRLAFRGVLRDADFGELWVGSHQPEHHRQLFVSVQTLNNQIQNLELSPDYYDFIIIDEVHHISASSYRAILNYFTPKLLLGLTATPERHDGTNILDDFCGTIAAELRLPHAINERYLCPFQYFAVDDTVDLSNASWASGRYLPAELTQLYTANDIRVSHILRNMQDIIGDLTSIKALAFCVTQTHAEYMAEKFVLKGIKAAVLTSKNGQERVRLRNQLVNGEINVLFVVDIFNEGIDIPEIDTVLFLRPTESLTVFLQQLGRGLRLTESKECLTVLDFVGNAHAEYDFASKFRALIGKSHVSTIDEVKQDFPHLPLGCSIVLQKQAKEVILRNISNAVVNQRKLLRWIGSYSEQTTRKLSLKNFLNFYSTVTLENIYRNKIDGGGGWNRLCIKARVVKNDIDVQVEQAMFRAISNRILQCTSRSYLLFLRDLFCNDFTWNKKNVVENQMALMAHYDFWAKAGHAFAFSSLQESLSALGKDKQLMAECEEVLDLVLDSLDTAELVMKLETPSALAVHARYSRDQILAAFGANTFEKKSSSREGVIDIKKLNVELLFVTLKKSDKKFSPTTMYHDYAINEYLFHWQSQNATRPDRGKGQEYIQHQKLGKKIILFVREQESDENGKTMGFINIGLVNIESYHGSKPMNITWRLTEPLPAYLWDDAAKLAVG